jgi:diketogulonate reductase-like aldo/keto reductase
MADTAKPVLRKIPGSDEALPVIGMGTSRTFDVELDEQTRQRLGKVLRIFLDRGGRLIDSSPMYGNAESVVGELLTDLGRSSDVFAATKVWTYGKQEGIQQMERSANRMGVDRLDLIQIHNLRDWRVHVETLQQWKEEGRVRYIGITTSHNRSHEELEQALTERDFDFVQFSYNILNRVSERRLLPLARQRGVAVLINRPFQRGELFRRVVDRPLPEWAREIDCTSWAQFFLKFVVSHPAVTCAIPATGKPHHMEDNMGAGWGRLPDERMRQRMVEVVEEL